MKSRDLQHICRISTQFNPNSPSKTFKGFGAGWLAMGEKSWTALSHYRSKCFHDCPTRVESLAFMFHSDLKHLSYSTVEKTVLHEVRSMIEDQEPLKVCCAVQLFSPMPSRDLIPCTNLKTAKCFGMRADFESILARGNSTLDPSP